MLRLNHRSDAGPLSVRTYGATTSAWSNQSAHAGLELAWVREGTLVYRLGATEVQVPVGGVLVVPEGVEHRTALGAGGSAESLHVGRDVVQRLEAELGLHAIYRGLAPGVVHLGTPPATSLRRAVGPSGEWASLVADGFLLNLLRRRLSDERLAELRDRRIAAAIERALDDAVEPVRVDDLLKVAGMSRFHFSREFKRRTGASPHQFLIDLRLKHAARLLERGATVTEAATRAGFTDLSRFGQQFRRRTGQTPRAFAQLPGHRSSRTGRASGGT